MILVSISFYFINHLHGGEYDSLYDMLNLTFINHLHGGEFTGLTYLAKVTFINHLHGGECPNYGCVIDAVVYKPPTRW